MPKTDLRYDVYNEPRQSDIKRTQETWHITNPVNQAYNEPGGIMQEKFMFHGVANTGIVPIRSHPSDASEMVNQLLLGETVEIISQEGVWSRIVSDFDAYEGWVSSGQIRLLSESEYQQWTNHPKRKRFPFRCIIAGRPVRQYLQIPVGAYVPVSENGIEWFGEEYRFQSEPLTMLAENVLDTAMAFLGVSYVWGGRTDNGLDCSGFIQTVYMLHGTTIPRDSTDQYESGTCKGRLLKEAGPGDIIFFKYQDRPVTHIGFYLGDGLLLHASSQVRIDGIDPEYQSKQNFPFNQVLSEAIAGIISSFSDSPINVSN